MTIPSETELRESLRLEADRIDAVGDFATAAIALERRRGRRRQATIAGAVAAVLAAAVAVPVLVHSGGGTTRVPVPASSSGQPSGSSASSEDGHPTSTSGQTALPPVSGTDAYVLDNVIHLGNREVQLGKNTQVENLAVLSNGGFFLQSHLSVGESSSEMALLSPDGRIVKELGPSGFYAVSPDGTRILVQDGRSSTITVLDPDGTVLAKRSDDRYPVALVDDHAYLQGDGSTTSLEWNYVTDETRKLPAHVAAVSTDRTRAALQWVGASDTFDNFCWAVVDLQAPEVPTLIERCGPKQNPDLFQPTAFSRDGTYLVGSNYVDGGFWFSAAVVRVSDGAMVLGGSGEKTVAGWTWRLDPDDTFVISRNTSMPKTEQNALQRCTLDLRCTELAPPLAVQPISGLGESFAAPRYVVPR